MSGKSSYNSKSFLKLNSVEKNYQKYLNSYFQNSLALGGWNDSQGDKYSRLVRSPSARKRFVAQAVQFLEKYGFNGLDLGNISKNYNVV